MYNSEVEKIKDKVSKYLSGIMLDIGSHLHFDKIHPDAIGVGLKFGANVSYLVKDVNDLSAEIPELVGMCDVVFSCHMLQNYKDHDMVLFDWIRFIKTGGYLILYLPDSRMYEYHNNPNHKHKYRYEDFLSWMGINFPQMKIVDSGFDVGPDKYSFYIVAKKMGDGFIEKEKPWLAWEEKDIYAYNRISSDDFSVLRKLYEDSMNDKVRYAIKSAVEEIIYLRKKYKESAKGR